MTTPQSRYYQSHRDAILPRMRDREKQRRELRKSKYGDDPSLHEEDKAIARRKYYKRVATENRKLMEDALAGDIPATLRHLLTTMMEDKTVITTAALRKMICGGYTNQMAKSKKEEVKSEESVVVPVVDAEEKPKKAVKVKKEVRRIVADPGEHLHIKVERGVKVTFD